MAFGQSSGPPASGKEIAQLADLLEQAGYGSFKEARHPFGLNQRQAGGKFTRDEAAELIERLEAEAEGGGADEDAVDAALVAEIDEILDLPPGAAPPRKRVPDSPQSKRAAEKERKLTLAALPDDAMATELELRGWTCIPPL